MKKVLLSTALAALLLLCYGCDGAATSNKQLLDMAWTFEYAIIRLPGGQIVEGDVEKWRDYSDGDQLQVTIDGTIYLTHASNVVLIHKKAE